MLGEQPRFPKINQILVVSDHIHWILDTFQVMFSLPENFIDD